MSLNCMAYNLHVVEYFVIQYCYKNVLIHLCRVGLPLVPENTLLATLLGSPYISGRGNCNCPAVLPGQRREGMSRQLEGGCVPWVLPHQVGSGHPNCKMSRHFPTHIHW